jgi:hypothetical protein
MAKRPLRIEARILLSFAASALLALVWISNISAAELPRELVLQCHGDTNLTVTRGPDKDVQKDTFHLALRLKDGSLRNLEYDFLEGNNCTFLDGIMRCELDTTTYNSELDTTTKEHRTIALNRTTGEINLMLESQAFAGATASGEPSITIKSSRTGYCHSAGTTPPF